MTTESARRRILVASTNPGKARELRAMLDADVEWVGLADFPGVAEVIEDGRTFAENARKKALGYARATGLWTIADDSGLVVDALSGDPGVRSARFSGVEFNGPDRDQANIAKVLDLLAEVPTAERAARFVCSLCLANPEKVLLEAEGTLEGLIARQQAGDNGFGYDPILHVPSLNKTVAQLTVEQKNAVSHRGNAIRKLKPLLAELLARSDI